MAQPKQVLKLYIFNSHPHPRTRDSYNQEQSKRRGLDCYLDTVTEKWDYFQIICNSNFCKTNQLYKLRKYDTLFSCLYNHFCTSKIRHLSKVPIRQQISTDRCHTSSKSLHASASEKCILPTFKLYLQLSNIQLLQHDWQGRSYSTEFDLHIYRPAMYMRVKYTTDSKCTIKLTQYIANQNTLS